MEVVHFLEHECRVESALQEILVLVEGLEVALDGQLHKREYLHLDTAQLLIRSVISEVLLLVLGEGDA